MLGSDEGPGVIKTFCPGLSPQALPLSPDLRFRPFPYFFGRKMTKQIGHTFFFFRHKHYHEKLLLLFPLPHQQQELYVRRINADKNDARHLQTPASVWAVKRFHGASEVRF